jgi:uncharacterized protein YgbK (DUF1537 family)
LITVIADDLTGAADAAVAFAMPAYVSLGADAPPLAVVAFDTDSRALPEAEAARRVHAAALAALRPASRLYKKIDSTLRGNAGSEIAAAVRAANEVRGKAVAIVCPAYPRTGRTVRGGRVLVHGVPPDDLPSVGDLLRAAGLNALRWRPGEAAPESANALVCDAEADDDLAAIARAGAALPHAVVWTGSAGLARHLTAALGLRAPAGPPLPKPAQGPVLTLVGSRAPMARAQAAALAESGAVEAIPLSAEAPAAVARALAAGRDVLVRIPEELEFEPARAGALAQALGHLAQVNAARIGGLVATGGDSARAALTALGAKGLYLVRELEAGVPLGVADGERPIPVVTKSGAFGDRDTLLRCHAALRRRTT